MKNSEMFQKYIDDLAIFIQHNLDLGYITEYMSIKDFKNIFLKDLSERYIPLIRTVEDMSDNFHKEWKDNYNRE